jgi:hypothetical protein
MINSAETVHGSPLKLVISGRDPFFLETIVVATSAVHLQNGELCLKSIGPDVYSFPTMAGDGDEVAGSSRTIISMIPFIFHRSTTTMVRVVQRQGPIRSIHRRPATALASFYWVAATWAVSSSPSSSSSLVVSRFGGTGGSPARGFGIPSQRRHSIWTAVSNICCGSTATKSIEDTTTETTTTMSSVQAKVDALRGRMKELGLDVYMVPTDDPHLSGTRNHNSGGDH